jgi:hypothetical protein
MNNFNKILFLLIAMLTFTYIYNNIYGYRVHTEKFTSNTQNYISTNQNNIANKLQYGDSNDTLISDDNSDTYGPSSLYGINQNSNTDIYDDRGYKWSTTYNNDNVDTLTDIVDNKQLQQNFERTYMLDPSGSVAKYDITYNTFLTGTTYSTNAVTSKQRVSQIVNYVRINFTDNTFWEDTNSSNYLIVRNDNVMFISLGHDINNPDATIQIGDNVILLDTTDGNFSPILKEVQSVIITKQIFDGWIIGVEREHLFLTQTSDNTSFVSIEHNVGCAYGGNLCQQSECPKGLFCTQRFTVMACNGTNLCLCRSSCAPVWND